MLVQVGENDSVAPPAAAWDAAAKADHFTEVRNYPVDHFDVYDGSWQEQVFADQLEFLARHLNPGPRPRHASLHRKLASS
ncbi:hypothetical protein [Aeromicrobium sp. NPDC092404]|uniref:hypothetical protein n=1 Tax=Aeromicrobium sp. NPDC092404 TaxID=3154976 RepID=UPI00343B3D2D